MSLLAELKRRNVLRMIAAYVVGAWLVVQVIETIFPAFGFGDRAIRLAVIVLPIGIVPGTFEYLAEHDPTVSLDLRTDRSSGRR